METNKEKYWQTLALDQLSQAEWESLCDGCGLCCLHKLQDEDTDEIVYTRIVCRYSDIQTGSCGDYAHRSINVPSCVPLTLERVAEFDWLPDSCAYRLRYFNLPLPDWHPLNIGDDSQVKYHGLQSINVVVESLGLDEEDYLIDKP
jgi:uncharacterized cysteine cluster protein YcgN (CxxCxxCC family)